jgi:hypothetical protein
MNCHMTKLHNYSEINARNTVCGLTHESENRNATPLKQYKQCNPLSR